MLRLREFHLQQNNIAVVPHLHPAALPALANREEIQSIVLNLILNAEQAIQLSGVGTRITVRSYSSGHHQVIEVSDDGPGIGPEIRGRIFEPFFTTKDVGQGTGLGLSISHGIAASHGGSLELCHGLDAGACHPRSSSRAACRGRPPRSARLDGALVVTRDLRTAGPAAPASKFEVCEAAGSGSCSRYARNQCLRCHCSRRQPPLRELTIGIPTQLCLLTGDRSRLHVEDGVNSLPVLESRSPRLIWRCSGESAFLRLSRKIYRLNALPTRVID